jgi:hypothetical protein
MREGISMARVEGGIGDGAGGCEAGAALDCAPRGEELVELAVAIVLAQHGALGAAQRGGDIGVGTVGAGCLGETCERNHAHHQFHRTTKTDH